jgi:FkbM family methyltransferase
MTFLDIGAHIGEFTLIGAKMVGSEGKAIAIEPLPPCVEAIRHNASINGLNQVMVFDGALCDYSGKIGFQSDAERSSGWISTQPSQAAFEAKCWTLDDFLPFAGIGKVDLIKLDAGGNELAVLRGGARALGAGKIGVLVMKLYHPNVTQERFGYDSHKSIELLREWGLQLKLVVRENAFPVLRPEDMNDHFDSLVYSHLLMATKC